MLPLGAASWRSGWRSILGETRTSTKTTNTIRTTSAKGKINSSMYNNYNIPTIMSGMIASLTANISAWLSTYISSVQIM